MKTFKIDGEFRNKNDLLEDISKKVANDSLSNYEVILSDLLKREEEYSTGLENGFAIPHCRTKEVKEPYIIICNLKSSIEDYDTLDGNKVDFIISFIVPDNVEGEEEHLRLLSGLMRRLVNEDIQNKVKSTDDIEELKNILEIKGE